jgi:hypothetical protein
MAFSLASFSEAFTFVKNLKIYFAYILEEQTQKIKNFVAQK